MSGTGPVEREQSDTDLTEQARDGVEKAETGDPTGANQLDQARNADPAGTQAAEQEAADGPEGQGLSR